MNDEDEGPGWEMQQDNEAQRWAEEQAAMNRSRRLTRELIEETRAFELECEAHRARVNDLTRTFGAIDV